MGYALLNHIFAKTLNLVPGELILMANDAHIYENQIPMCIEQLDRKNKLYSLPQLNINKEITSLDDILALEYKDINLHGYDSHPDIKKQTVNGSLTDVLICCPFGRF